MIWMAGAALIEGYTLVNESGSQLYIIVTPSAFTSKEPVPTLTKSTFL